MASSRRTGLFGALLALVVAVGAADYQIQPGDTVSELARDHGTTIQAIVDANGLDDPDFIIAGEQLVIPGRATSHTVEAGDTLSAIAKLYGVSPTEIAKANDIANRDIIVVGATLEIPLESSSVTVTHAVVPGETLSEIAARYGTTVTAIAKLNDITDVDRVVSGSELLVTSSQTSEDAGPTPTVADTSTTTASTTTTPTTTTTAAPPAAVHTVVFGETLGDIAVLYGVPSSAIVEANGIADPDAIVAGTTLEIPDAASTPAPSETSGMQCPVPSASFVDDFGVVKPDGRFHQGIDMFADRGTSVYAPVKGSVEAVNGNLGGLQFWLTAPDGTIYIGTHLDGFGKVGEVNAGDVIGIVGDTGNAIGAPPHLHFEILEDGTAIDPYQRLVEACG